MLKSFFLLLFLAIVSSCGTTKKAAVPTVVNTLPVLQESFINIPLKIYIRPFLGKAETMTPIEFTSTGWPGYLASGCDFRYKYRFLRSGLRFSCVNSKAVITLVGSYQLAGSKSVCAFGKQVSPWITGSCGFSPEAMRRVEINIGSLFRFQSNYTLQSLSAVERINPVDKCIVTVLSTDVTNEVIDSIRASVNAFSSSIDQTISKINFTKVVQEAGEKIGRKMPLSTYGFIKVNPASVSIGNINLLKDTMYVSVGFSCFPALSSDSNNYAITNFLPPLGNSDLNGGFIINANASYEYPFLDGLLTRAARNKRFEIEGKTVIINSISVRGLENNIVELRVNFSGNKSGTIYFTGSPVLDVKNQVISIPDLDYSLKSRDLILTLGKTFFNSKIIGLIRQKAVLKTRDIYLQNKTRLDSALNRTITKNIYSTGNTQEIQVTGLVIKRDNLLFQVSARGMLSIVVAGY